MTHFDSGVHSVSQVEINLMNIAAQAIIAAGPGARIVVGAHVDAVGDPKLNEDSARRRAASVIGELKSRGVPAFAARARDHRGGARAGRR